MYPFNQKLVAVGADRAPVVRFEAPAARGGVQRRVTPASVAPAAVTDDAAAAEARAANRFAVATVLTSLVLWTALIVTLASSLEVPTVL